MTVELNRETGKKGGQMSVDPLAVRRTLDSEGRGSLRPTSVTVPAFNSELSRIKIDALRKSPEHKAELRRKKFLDELDIWQSLQLDTPADQLDIRIRTEMRVFDRLPTEDQKQAMLDIIRDGNTKEISRGFAERLKLEGDLLKETGEDPQVLAKSREITQKVFANKPRNLKGEEFRHMDSAIAHLLIEGFPRHTSQFRTVGGAEAELDFFIQQFNRAQTDQEKSKISAHLRQRVKELRAAQDVLIDHFEAEMKKPEEAKPVAEIQKEKTDEEIFVKAASEGPLEDFDAIEDNWITRVPLAIRGYIKSLQKMGISAKLAEKAGRVKEKALVATLFGHQGHESFMTPKREANVRDAQEFVVKFTPKKANF